MLLCNALPGAVIPMTVALLQVGLVGQSMQCFHHISRRPCCAAWLQPLVTTSSISGGAQQSLLLSHPAWPQTQPDTNSLQLSGSAMMCQL